MKWYLQALSRYFYFSGRARRKEFWMFLLFDNIFYLLALVLDVVIVACGLPPLYLAFIYFLATFIPCWAVTFRRLHDIGASGWYSFLNLIPLLGWIWFIVLLCLPSNPYPNQYGPNPKDEDDEEYVAYSYY